MNPAQFFLRLFVFFLAIAAHAEPENFLLSHFTFVRPLTWQWVPNTVLDSSTIVMKITGDDTNEIAQMVMVHYQPGAGLGKRIAVVKRWKEQFVDPQVETNKVRIGTNSVIYTEVKGPRKPVKPGVKEQPDSALIGAVIEDAKGNIVLKMIGPRSTVQKCKADFQKMIADALTPE